MAKKNDGAKTPLTKSDLKKQLGESMEQINASFALITAMLENQNVLLTDMGTDAAKGRKAAKRAAAAASAVAENVENVIESGEVSTPPTSDVTVEGDFAFPVPAAQTSTVADDLAALGHPIRLEMIRLCSDEPRKVRDLAEDLGKGTTGQIYHHLRQLTTAGWLIPAENSAYQVNPARATMLAAILRAAL